MMGERIAQAFQLQEQRIAALETAIVVLCRKIAKVYAHNDAARSAVIQTLGLRHSPLVREVLDKTEEK